ncbi:ABC transporter ATP-binding protein [Phytoactinopolyspora halotolerans]|uniref:ABC transporter ATP-binding protein n=1 Tax=Phytoactinopolyspora halotolerans TaxID=1981512 RepID=A0A6L9S5Z0_9ACTN|nr:ABC transporter ATP-binding protein [Phytoactinopolyspora halotolerans]NEE00457.1 ABC transporter ATP-binding protein [Phytoactinopolyspora halotolerans]
MTTTGTPLLQVENLRVHLPTGSRTEVEAVSSVSLAVRRGERVGIVGESGSGKTVTGRAIAGLLPTSPRVRVQGSIRFDGREMVGAPPKAWDQVRSRTVGMVFQDPLTYLNPVMKIGRQVHEAIPPGRQRSGENGDVLHFLSLAGLENVRELAQRFPHELSGGMRQRVLIAIAIAKMPDLLVADEPTTALDATVQQRVLTTLDETVAELDTSLILISHDIAVVAGMTDRIYVMYAGHVVESGRTREVLEKPEHPYTQALLRSVRSLTEDGVELYSIPESLRASWARKEEARAS